ncbi:hypothetical protein C8R46DRAFT_1117211 [Mycena filopes]|nr:hypothetical protein C8R46DRAFT_1117211 [Mycena filopes]
MGCLRQSLLFRHVHIRRHTLAAFLALLAHPKSIHLARYITALRLTAAHGGTQHPNLLDALQPMLVKKKTLSALHTLDLSYLHFARIDEVPRGPGCGATIVHLQLRFCVFPTPQTMLAFLASFPLLVSLDIFLCRTQELPPPDAVQMNAGSAAIRMPAWRLTHLALGEFPASSLLAWLVAQPAPLAVAHLRIRSLGADASPFNALLAKIGGSLQRLDLPGLRQCKHVVGPQVPISLEACTALSTLTFDDDPEPGAALGVLLASLPAPELVVVSFAIRLCTFVDDSTTFSSSTTTVPFFAAEAQTALLAMRGVKFALRDAGDAESDTRFVYEHAIIPLIKARMARLEAGDLLRFVYVGDDVVEVAPVEFTVLAPKPRPRKARRRSFGFPFRWA